MIKHSKERWEDKEVVRLIKLWEKDMSIQRIAKKLKRSQAKIRSKISNLRRSNKGLAKRLRHRTINERYKLTKEQIPGIRADKRKLREIMKDYKVSMVTIHKIKTGKTWKNA